MSLAMILTQYVCRESEFGCCDTLGLPQSLHFGKGSAPRMLLHASLIDF